MKRVLMSVALAAVLAIGCQPEVPDQATQGKQVPSAPAQVAAPGGTPATPGAPTKPVTPPGQVVKAPKVVPIEGAKDTGPAGTITFTATEHDFGTVNQGDKLTHTFTFKNTGKGLLKVTKARGG